MSVCSVNRVYRQDGIALISVLLIVAILTAAISRLALENQIWLSQVENNASLTRTLQAGSAAQRWIALLLERDDDKFDGYTDLWAQSMPPIPIAKVQVQGHIEDMQARFNLNNLVDNEGKVDAVSLEKFERLLQILELDPDIAMAVVDWIDPDSTASGSQGAEDDYYIGLDPAYLAANQPLTQVEELKLVRGIDSHTWFRLQPHVTALQQITPVNVNTANVEVLAAVVTNWGRPAIALGEAKRWIGQIEGKPVEDLKTFAAMALPDTNRRTPDNLSVNSNYFMAYTRMELGKVEQHMSTLYYRNNGRAVMLRQQREFN